MADPVDAVVVVDKPPGQTSHDVVAAVRRALGGRRGSKVGHAGTLDPDATGVLVLCIGRATRLVPWLQAGRKTYDARMRLGVRTSTLDAGGEVVATADASGIDEAAVCEALKAFVGPISQIPPMVSAVKVGGERLYAKARRGEVVDRAPRAVVIHDLVLSDFEPGASAEAAFLVTCSPGTYVRTLAADVGDRLGVGASLVSLRRLGSGRFSASDALPLEQVVELASSGRLVDVAMTPAEAMADYPSRALDVSETSALSHGRRLSPTGVNGPVAALAPDGRLVAVVQDEDSVARPLVVLAPATAAVEADA